MQVQCLVYTTEKMQVREQVDNEQGIVSLFIQIAPLHYPRRKKMTFTFAFWQGLGGSHG